MFSSIESAIAKAALFSSTVVLVAKFLAAEYASEAKSCIPLTKPTTRNFEI